MRGVDAFEPVANLRRCYLRQDPVFLRSLLRLVGRRVDRLFYLAPPAGRSERPCRAPRRLRVRPAAQQLATSTWAILYSPARIPTLGPCSTRLCRQFPRTASALPQRPRTRTCGTRFLEDDLAGDPEAGALASNGQGRPPSHPVCCRRRAGGSGHRRRGRGACSRAGLPLSAAPGRG